MICCLNYWVFLNKSQKNKNENKIVPSSQRTLFLCQLVNTATSLPADDVHHYAIPPKLLLTNRVYFQQTSGIHAPVGKREGCSLSGRSPASIADIFNVTTIARKQRVKFTRN
jgi:hypothetical protein